LRRIFYASLIAGLALTLLAAGLMPLPEHYRYRSSIGVLTNGGRQEDFTIDWPRDRVTVAPTGSLQSAGGALMLQAADGAWASAELFRLRDVAGNVIGLASRTTSTVSPARAQPVQATDWMLYVPSRGALFLRQFNAIDVAPRPRANGAGLVAAPDLAAFWSAGTKFRISAGPHADGGGEVLRGTGEFAGLVGSYDETWELAEVAADGATRGRISLSTRTMAAR
jgi:hypothetical protein